MGENNGIFIRCQEVEVEMVIRGCKAILEGVDGQKVLIKGVMWDNNYGGFRVYFSEDSVIKDCLKLKYLPLSGGKATIHSLTTTLTFHYGEFTESEEDFKDSLKNKLSELQLKPILGIHSIPISPEHRTIQSGNWLFEINIPGVEDLDVFKNNGLPYYMTLTLPNTNREKRVTYFCHLCHDIEHSRERCSELVSTHSCEDSDSETTSPEPRFSKSPPRFEIRERSSVGPTTLTSNAAKQHRIDAIASDLGRKKTLLSNQSPLAMGQVKIKQEPEDDEEYNSPLSRVAQKRPLITNDLKGSKKKRFNVIQDDDARLCGPTTASSTTTRDSPVIVYDSIQSLNPTRNSSADRRPSRDSLQYDRDSSSHEDSNATSFYLPTSSQPETNSEIESSFAPRDTSDYSDSNESISKPRSKRKKPVYAQVVLPNRIKKIVESRELKDGELTAGQLEAFFNHVKKKMSPGKVAKQFTDDVPRLKEQLIWIVRQYYNQPKAGSGEDSRFMKWLEGMLERFDSVPSKRKKVKSEPED